MDGAFDAGPINHADLRQEQVKKEELTLITDTIHPPISTTSDIKNRTLLVFPYGCSYRNYLEQWIQSEGIVPSRIIEFDSLGAIISSVCAGLGVSLLPISAVEQYIKAFPLSTLGTKD